MKVSSMVLKFVVAVATSSVSVSAFAIIKSMDKKASDGTETTVSTCPHQTQIKGGIRADTAYNNKAKSAAPHETKNVKSGDGVG